MKERVRQAISPDDGRLDEGKPGMTGGPLASMPVWLKRRHSTTPVFFRLDPVLIPRALIEA